MQHRTNTYCVLCHLFLAEINAASEIVGRGRIREEYFPVGTKATPLQDRILQLRALFQETRITADQSCLLAIHSLCRGDM